MARWVGRPQSRWIDGVWGAGVVWGMIALVLFVIPPFPISRQTTYLTEPRSKEFYGINYAAVIEKQLDPGVPAEENGFRLLTETLGRSLFDTSKDEHWNRLCRYLDLSPDLEPKQTFVGFWNYVKTLPPEEKEIIEAPCNKDIAPPWSEEAIPIVRRWLDDNDTALDLFVVAVRKPALYIPPMFDGILISTILTNDYTLREMARNLRVRMRYRLAIGEIDKAWDDVLTIYHLGEQHRRAVWIVVSSLVNNAIVETANRSAESVLTHSDWSADEIRRKIEEILPFQQPFRDDEIVGILRNERFTALYSVTHIVNGTYDVSVMANEKQPLALNSWERFKTRSTMRFLRMGIIMVAMNRYFDEGEQRYFNDEPEPNDKRITPGMYGVLKMFAWYGHFGWAPVLIGQVHIDLLGTPFEGWRTSFKTRQTNVSLLRLLFALEAYKRDNGGNYPEKLDDLQTRYLETIPLDPFSGEAFRYLAEPSEVLLYSVGPNGIDEQGRNWSDTPRGDDIRRRIR
jgi:hypothetical protein